jgi:hypothetical protein
MHIKFETQTKYARLKDEVQLTDHKKIVSRSELENMNNQITCPRKLRPDYLQPAMTIEMR